MSQPVFAALLPVVLLIAVGWLAGRRGWMGAVAARELSNLVFLLLAPALLFRAMSNVPIAQLQLRPVLAYFIGSWLIFFAMLAWKGFHPRAAVLALAGTYGNTVMIGIPLVGLAYGGAGMVTLLTLVSLHALIMLTLATVVLELAVAREAAASGLGERRHMAATVALAVRNAVIHPVPLPILAGLAFSQLGWHLPPLIDRPLELLGQAFGPLSLLMVGITLAHTEVRGHLGGALGLMVVKNLVHPVLVAGIGLALGLSGLPLVVMVVAAAMPVGANVFLFSQRYRVAEELVTASVVVSTAAALVTVTITMLLAQRL